jgi:hypothetical protein
VEGKGVHDEEEKWREKESMMRTRSGGKGVYDEEEKWRPLPRVIDGPKPPQERVGGRETERRKQTSFGNHSQWVSLLTAQKIK